MNIDTIIKLEEKNNNHLGKNNILSSNNKKI